MAKIIVTENGHLSLEYAEKEHRQVKKALLSLDNKFNVALRLDSAKINVRGVKFVAGSDEMGRFIISTSKEGDDLLRTLLNKLA